MSHRLPLSGYGPAAQAQIIAALQDRPPGPVQSGSGDTFVLEARKTTDEDRLNKTEAAFLAYLRASHVEHLAIQAITLKLADDCRYTVDFTGIREGRLMAWEVKGFFRDDAKVKIRVAARMFPWILFVLVRKQKGGGWTLKEVNP